MTFSGFTLADGDLPCGPAEESILLHCAHISNADPVFLCLLTWLLRCLPLWVGARGIEFDWKYIQMSFDSNISLVSSFCVGFVSISSLMTAVFGILGYSRGFRHVITLLYVDM